MKSLASIIASAVVAANLSCMAEPSFEWSVGGCIRDALQERGTSLFKFYSNHLFIVNAMELNNDGTEDLLYIVHPRSVLLTEKPAAIFSDYDPFDGVDIIQRQYYSTAGELLPITPEGEAVYRLLSEAAKRELSGVLFLSENQYTQFQEAYQRILD